MDKPELGMRTRDVVGQAPLGKLLWSKVLNKPDRSLPRKARSVHVFALGLVLADASDCVSDTFRWDDVAQFTKKVIEHKIQGPTQVSGYKVKWTDFGFTFALPEEVISLVGTTDKRSVSVLETFGALVSPLIRDVQLPGMLAAIERGETLDFAGLKVSQAGLSRPAWRKKNTDLAWADITTVRLADGELTINCNTTWSNLYTTCRVADTPNFDALVALLQAFMPAG